MKQENIIRYEKRIYVPEAELHLQYYLYTNPAGDGSGRRIYDLEILGMDPTGRDVCFISDIATSSSMAEKIWRVFTDELVTPITAEDILADLLSDKSFLQMADDMF